MGKMKIRSCVIIFPIAESFSMVALSKSSETSIGMQSTHEYSDASTNIENVGRIQFACVQVYNDTMQQSTAEIATEERGE